KMELTASADTFRCRWNESPIAIDRNVSLETQLAPENSGGALLALMTWHRMLSVGPHAYGDVIYLGRAPVVDRDRMADVFVATYDVVESRFYFDVDTAELLLIEMYPDSDVDPCELHFRDYQTRRDGRLWPSEIRIQLGDSTFDSVTLNEFEISAAPESSGGVE
ncbi:hypothetical protein ACFL2H_09300, partial [Planctomycetota bacterium]